MKPNSKDNPIIGRVVTPLIDLENMGGEIIKRGTECTIIKSLGRFGYVIKSHCGIELYPIKEDDITDDFSLFIITHYECVKDDKVILSSDEPQEVDSVDDFKKRVKLLIICDKVNVEFRKI